MAQSNPLRPPTSSIRWFHPTPERVIIGILGVNGLLLLSEQFNWLAFNEKKGYTAVLTVLVTISILGVLLIWYAASFYSRLRFQFNVRSLLILFFAVSIPFCWLAIQMIAAEKQRSAIDAIQSAGCETFYDWQIGDANKPPPSWLQFFFGVDMFSHVYSVQEAGIIGPSVSLRSFQDDTITQLENFPKLELLHIPYSSITESGLVNLSALAQLKYLTLSGTLVTDAGMVHLQHLGNLESLYLGQTQLTDMCIEHLARLKSLKKLSLVGTNVSDEGLNRIHQLLPNCDMSNYSELPPISPRLPQ